MANITISPGYNKCNINADILVSNGLTHSSRVTLLSFAVVNGLAALPTFLVNFLVMWAVLESPHLRSSNYNILVAILSLTDTLTGLVVQPLFLSFSVCYLSNCPLFCELGTAFSLTGLLNGRWTLATLAIVCVERYIFINHPLTYPNKVSIHKTLTTAVVSWLVIAVGTAVQQIDHKHAFFVSKLVSFTFLPPIIATIVFCSVKIHLTVRRQRRTIAAALPQGDTSRHSKLKEIKRIHLFQISLFIFVMQYSPLVISQIFWTFNEPGLASSVRIITASLTVTCVFLNSLINPFLYSIRLSDISKGVRSKLPEF